VIGGWLANLWLLAVGAVVAVGGVWLWLRRAGVKPRPGRAFTMW